MCFVVGINNSIESWNEFTHCSFMTSFSDSLNHRLYLKDRGSHLCI